MNELKRVVDTVYEFLTTEVGKMDLCGISALEEMRTIKDDNEYFFLIVTLEPEDVDFFIMNYIRYMKSYYKECDEVMILHKFWDLKDNIMKTANLLKDPSLNFIYDNSSDNFFDGFLCGKNDI